MPDPLHPLLERAVHGGPDARTVATHDFSVNSNPYGPSPALVRAAREADATRYTSPDLVEVRTVLADWHDVDPDDVVPGVGASELLHRIARAFVRPGASVLSVGPVFGEFARGVRLAGADVRESVPETAVHDVLGTRPTLVYLSRPNNPLGTIPELGLLDDLADACALAGALLVLDEAYAPLAPGLAAPHRHPSVIRVQSPGKAHGVVGMRLAYALAPREVARALHNLAPAWELPAGTEAALRALPDAQTFVDRTVLLWRDAAARLAHDLARLAPVRSNGLPFLTVDVGEAAPVASALLSRGVRVRDCASYGHPHLIRVSARTPDENAVLVAALREVFRG